MGLERIETKLSEKIEQLRESGTLKGSERVITGIRPPADGYGPRYFLQGGGDTPFLRMNANAYLGLHNDARVIRAEEDAARRFGTGPGAVRFISGTYEPHVELEAKLAAFHGRPAGMVFSAAYATVMGVLPQFIAEDTLVVSDALNHNCIINAIRLARPAQKAVYPHLDMAQLNAILEHNNGRAKRALVVTDGIFSMRGDHAPLDQIQGICRRHEAGYEEGIVTVVDDSHGVGAFGTTGRGTEEHTGAQQADLLIATLGKALGVNGGYVVASQTVIDYLRETVPLYIYSNPITPAEAAAATQALEILDSPEGRHLLDRLRHLAAKLRAGLKERGLETLAGEHPIVPLLIRDTTKTKALVDRLFARNILATGLCYPVVPRGDEEIRIQISAEHTERDIDYLLQSL